MKKYADKFSPNSPFLCENWPKPNGEIPDIVLATLATIGSTLGAFGAMILSKLYLNSFAPTGCGTIGCMVGGLIFCVTGDYCWRIFRKTSTLRMSQKSGEQHMEEEVHASRSYC